MFAHSLRQKGVKHVLNQTHKPPKHRSGVSLPVLIKLPNFWLTTQDFCAELWKKKVYLYQLRCFEH